MKRRAVGAREAGISSEPNSYGAIRVLRMQGSFTLAWLCILVAPPIAEGFFRPTPRVIKPPGGPRVSNAVPSTPRPIRLRLRESSLPLLVMHGAEVEDAGHGEGEVEEEDVEEGEGEVAEGDGVDVRQRASSQAQEEEDERIAVPSVDIPEMMDDEERVRLWMAVAKAEGEAVRMERAGRVEEAATKRARAEELKREDPYTELQDQLDEAIKKEEYVKIARLRLIMRKIGVPPNPEMQARAMGKDMNYIRAQAAKQMPGMTSRESEGNSRSGTRSDGTTVSDGYSSKSVTTTHGVRVEVRSQYYPEQSNPLKDQYIFVYKVKITNQTRQTVQLVSRSWEIKAVEASEAPQVVKGPGVVGKQPVLEPGQSFEYSSACPITCAPKEGYQVLGRMKGSYLIVMGAVGEAAFEAKIDPFYLILPKAVLEERARGKNGGGGGGNEGTAGGDVAESW